MATLIKTVSLETIDALQEDILTAFSAIDENKEDIYKINESITFTALDGNIYSDFSNVAWLDISGLKYMRVLGEQVSNFYQGEELVFKEGCLYDFEITSVRNVAGIDSFYKDQVKVTSNNDKDFINDVVFRVGKKEASILDPVNWKLGSLAVDVGDLTTQEQLDIAIKQTVTQSRKDQIGNLWINYDNAKKNSRSIIKGGIEYLLPELAGDLKRSEYKDLADFLAIPKDQATFKLPSLNMDAVFRFIKQENARNLGSYEEDAMQKIKGSFGARDTSFAGLGGCDGVFSLSGIGRVGPLDDANGAQDGNMGYVFDNSTVARTAEETRMKNIAAQVYIAAKVVEDFSGVSGGISINAVDNLQTGLDGKALKVHTHAIGDITDLQKSLDDLQAGLDGKALKVHNHVIADITDLQKSLDDLQTGLDGKALKVHNHVIADITDLQKSLDDLQTGLDGKALKVHTHAIGDITDLQTTLDGKANLIERAYLRDTATTTTDLSTAISDYEGFTAGSGSFYTNTASVITFTKAGYVKLMVTFRLGATTSVVQLGLRNTAGSGIPFTHRQFSQTTTLDVTNYNTCDYGLTVAVNDTIKLSFLASVATTILGAPTTGITGTTPFKLELYMEFYN